MKKKIIQTRAVLWGCLGTPGAHTIGQNVPQIVVNLLEFGIMDMQQAIDAPKITFVEPDMIAKGIPEETFVGLRVKGN